MDEVPGRTARSRGKAAATAGQAGKTPPPDRFAVPAGFDAAALTEDLAGCLERFVAEAGEDPFSNPVMHLGLEITRRLDDGRLDHGALELLVRHLAVEGFTHRARRFGRHLGETDPEVNTRHLRQLLTRLAVPQEGGPPVPFDTFRRHVEREVFGIVITAHPTFNLSGSLMTTLVCLATGRDEQGRPLDEAATAALAARLAAGDIGPDADLSLAREHELSLQAIANIQAALRRLYTLVCEVAAEVYPDRWTEVTPRLITVASWVGYDLDGRSDIRWTDTLHKRLKVQVRQLRRILETVQAIRTAAPPDEELAHTLDQVESRMALALHEACDEVAVFASHNPDSPDAVRQIQRIGRRLYENRAYRLVDGAVPIERLNRAIRLLGASGAADVDLVRRLTVLRAEVANYGLGMAHTHVRINSTQLHNAIRKVVELETTPDDPRYRQSYLERITLLLNTVRPVSINFGSIIGERTSAKRLFMVVAQMLKYTDAATPVRFLIAECEAAFTVLTALYYARLFGIADRLDISPLFETERALELGSRVIDALLENPHYRAYIQERGRLCIQTGYSDAGRYLGQTPAAASIERLRQRVARLFAKHRLTGVQLVVFDTHGESIGRGCHPGGLTQRLSYIAPPAWLKALGDQHIDFKQEVSFQGGDGYLHFVTETAAFAVVTRILEYFLNPPPEEAPDPFYEENDYITEFFTTVKEFQVSLMRDPNYAVLLTTFGGNLLPSSGSRATQRQADSTADDIEQMSASRIRAIPHNAILQQLGLPANTIGGVGAAIDKDPERYRALVARSPRFRQLLGLVEYGLAIADADVLKAYVDMVDPGLWLTLAAKAASHAKAEECRQIAAFLEDNPAHVRQTRIYRKLFRDVAVLRDDIAPMDTCPVGSPCQLETPVRTGLRLLHAVRLALIHQIYHLAMQVPDFSSQHETTRDRLITRLLHLDVATATAQLAVIFPIHGETGADGDFGEPASYVSEETQNYGMENERIFQPMSRLHDVITRVGTAIVQRIGFFG
jgi:phosphoenolpyruvate carboxylase